jgi:hypothetical protein
METVREFSGRKPSLETWQEIRTEEMFTRIFLPVSSFSHVRAKERNAALLAAYAPKPREEVYDRRTVARDIKLRH